MSANGKFAKFRNGSTIVPLDPQIVVEADWTVPSGASEVSFRVTDQLEINYTSTYKVQLWDNSLMPPNWRDQVTLSPMPNYWQTQVATFNVADSPYIDGSGVVRARIRVNSPTPALTWNIDVDQMVFLYK